MICAKLSPEKSALIRKLSRLNMQESIELNNKVLSLDELVQKAKVDLKDESLLNKQIWDAISGRLDQQGKVSDVRREFTRIQSESRLMAQIEEAVDGVSRGTPSRQKSQKIIDLRKKLNIILKEKGLINRKRQDAKRLERLNETLKQLEETVRLEVTPAKTTRPKPIDSEIIAKVKKDIQEVRSQVNLKLQIQTLRSVVKEMQETKTIPTKEKKPTKEVSREVENLFFERDKLKKEFSALEGELKPTGLFGKLLKQTRLIQTVNAFGDLGVLLRQGGIAFRKNPFQTTQEFRDSMGALIDAPTASRIYNEMISDPSFRAAERARLAIDNPIGISEIGNDVFTAAITEKIPGFSALNRQMAIFLNQIRFCLSG